MTKKMKLVEILARELKEWPESAKCAAQDGDGEVKFSENMDALPDSPGGVWLRSGNLHIQPISFYVDVSEDQESSIVTQGMWESERAKLAKPKGGKDGWRRHRGGKQPVATGVIVKYRMRSGRESSDEVAAEELRWDHSGSPGDIMSYKVVGQKEKSAPEPVKEPEQAIDTPNPIQWRDRVKELDERKLSLDQAHAKHTADIAKEREELIGKLEELGFRLIVAPAEEAEDMSDWRNWLPGDVVTPSSKLRSSLYKAGKEYVVTHITGSGNVQAIDEAGQENGADNSCFIWIRRPSK